ncbi:MAG TPA: cytochrome c oxidase subunit 3 family protein [Thermoanaerobaculia bacterium]|nr:cytochrome c oxidase subunit 3 family protein [Thermoanaerobaculia bacterium]
MSDRSMAGEAPAPRAHAVAHQFDDAAQQHEAGLLGMWTFLVTEILFFGGMFAGYTVYRSLYPNAFRAGSHAMNLQIGSINTAVLILSSLTMALAVHASQTGRKKPLVAYLSVTMLFGLIFLGFKAIEWTAEFREHHVPGPHFSFGGPDPVHSQIFFSFYFAMTGMHALHMVIGLGLMTFLLITARQGRYGPEYHAPVVVGGLYWHFVDIVWIFLYPLLYLIGARK